MATTMKEAHSFTHRSTPGHGRGGQLPGVRGWTSGSTVTFIINGGTYAGHFDPATGEVTTVEYRCSATKLVWLSGGEVTDTETRVSTAP